MKIHSGLFYMSSEKALRAAISKAGSQKKLAKILGTTQQAISWWLKRTLRAPAEHVLAIENATGVSRHDLRPDLYPKDSLPR